MSQLTAAANFSRMQSLRNTSTAGGGGGDRCRCCGGGVGVPIVSTHAVSSACCQPSASNSTISTSRRLRDGRATTAARRIRDGRATALRGRTWRDRCGVANAMTPAVAGLGQHSSSGQVSLRLMPPLPRDLQNAARCYRCSPCCQAFVAPEHEGPVHAQPQIRPGDGAAPGELIRSSPTLPSRWFNNNNDKKEVS